MLIHRDFFQFVSISWINRYIIISDISHCAIGLKEIPNMSAGMTVLFENTISIIVHYITPVRHSGSVQNLTDGNSCETPTSIINSLETIPDKPE